MVSNGGDGEEVRLNAEKQKGTQKRIRCYICTKLDGVLCQLKGKSLFFFAITWRCIFRDNKMEAQEDEMYAQLEG